MAMQSKHRITRRVSRQIHVGNVPVGGDAPISVQSMTNTETEDVDATVEQIQRIQKAGADIVRVAVPERKDTEALVEILDQTRVPIVADVHFHHKRAPEAIEAGVHKIRLNPGNISHRDQANPVTDACHDAKVPIRVGDHEAVP